MNHIVWNIKQLADTLQESVNHKFDFIVAVDGRRGLGKSTLAVKTALRFDTFKMKKHILFSRDDILDALAKLKYHVLVLDEMINVTHNRDFYAENQKKLIKMLNMYRDSGNIIFACVPNFAHLDNQFRDLVKMRIHIERRGLGIIHTPNQSAYKTDKWDMAINEKIENAWLKRGGEYIPNYSKLSTFRGMINFNALTEKQQELYDKIKYDKRNQVVVGEQEQNGESPHDRIYRLVQQGLITKKNVKTIGMALGMTHTAIIHALRRKAEKEGIDYKNLFVEQETNKGITTISHKNHDKKVQIPRMVTNVS